MTDNELRKGLKSLINKKMDKDYECQIEDSKSKIQYFIKSYDSGKTYSLYRGCDLEVGDVTIDYIVGVICSLHKAIVGEIKNRYIEFWGGCVDMIIVNNLIAIPQGSRYVCTDDKYDIYEALDGTVYGIADIR